VKKPARQGQANQRLAARVTPLAARCPIRLPGPGPPPTRDPADDHDADSEPPGTGRVQARSGTRRFSRARPPGGWPIVNDPEHAVIQHAHHNLGADGDHLLYQGVGRQGPTDR